MSNHREENFLDNLYRFTIFFHEAIELFAIKTEKMLKNYKISISIFNTGKVSLTCLIFKLTRFHMEMKYHAQPKLMKKQKV